MVEIFVSSIIPASVERVWAVMRDFNAMPAWHPLIADSRIETGAPADKIGCVRNFTLKNGSRIREKLLSLSDEDCSFTYSILEADVALENYVAGVRLRPVTDGDVTFGAWWAKFTCPPENEQELRNMVAQEVFQAGFDALKSRFA